MLAQQATVIVLALGLATGCGEQLSLLARSPVGGLPHEVFWPPPTPTSIWTSGGAPPVTFGDAAVRIGGSLRDAGYTDARWYPIGAEYAHGFAIVTRLERTGDGARPADARWLSLYPEASNLRWLDYARAPRFPEPGRYRVLLIAFTDLPMGANRVATRWNAETWMDGSDPVAWPLPASRRISAAFRVAVCVYEYASKGQDEEGAFLNADLANDSGAQVRGAGLSTLDQLGR